MDINFFHIILLLLGTGFLIFSCAVAYLVYHVIRIKQDLQNAVTDAARKIILEQAPALIRKIYTYKQHTK